MHDLNEFSCKSLYVQDHRLKGLMGEEWYNGRFEV